MSTVKTAASWLLFWLGHVASRPISWWGWAWPYPAYSWLMEQSVRLDENCKVWEEPK